MATWAAPAEEVQQPRTLPRVVRRREPRVTGGVLWIGVIAVLLAGVVARERADLRAKNAELSSQLSSAASTPRIQALAARSGLVQATPQQTHYFALPR
jgi:hypothetical protein